MVRTEQKHNRLEYVARIQRKNTRKVLMIRITTMVWTLPHILECEVKSALGSITANKSSGSNGAAAELFQILKDDAVKVLHSIGQQIWKTQ